MKKYIFIIITMAIFIYTLVNINLDKDVLINSKSKIKKENSISMMYETEAGSGIYQEAKNSLFPSDGYTFNSVLSKCENGSTLEYDKSTGKVMMNANASDRCYIYFDVKTCIPFLDIGTKLSTSEVLCITGFGTCELPTYKTSNFPTYKTSTNYITNFSNSDVGELLYSYYVSVGVGGILYYTNNQEFALYNEYYISYTGGAEDYNYMYHFSMKEDFCDLCVNGYTDLVYDCNQEDWWKS